MEDTIWREELKKTDTKWWGGGEQAHWKSMIEHLLVCCMFCINNYCIGAYWGCFMSKKKIFFNHRTSKTGSITLLKVYFICHVKPCSWTAGWKILFLLHRMWNIAITKDREHGNTNTVEFWHLVKSADNTPSYGRLALITNKRLLFFLADSLFTESLFEMNSSIQAAVMNLFSSHQQTTKLTILACSDSRDSWFDQEDARDVCPAAPWTRCVSGWRCVSAPSFQGRSSTTIKCVCGRYRALHRWCSAQTAFSPSTTPLDQRRPRMRCMSPAYSPWWRPWLAAITPPSSATDKQGQGRHTHWRGETWVGWRLARGSSIVLIDTHFKQGFGISFRVLLGSCFLATARLAHNSILRVLNTQWTVDWISGGAIATLLKQSEG